MCRYLYDNDLTGPIPEAWKNMENMQDLYVLRVSTVFLVLESEATEDIAFDIFDTETCGKTDVYDIAKCRRLNGNYLTKLFPSWIQNSSLVNV